MAQLIKKVAWFLLPVFVLSLCYVITDPFKTIFTHKSYNSTYWLLSRGNVSTMVFLNNLDKYHYDSFIFGSSRSTAHTARQWAKYLPPNSSAFSFGAWNENVENIYKRLKLIDSLQVPIRNVFILIDVDKAFKYSGDITADHYLVTGISKYDYYKKDYLYYLKTPRLFITSVDYTLFHKQRTYMTGFAGMASGDPDPVTNDWTPNSELSITLDSANYYKNTDTIFYKRPSQQQYAVRQIDMIQYPFLLKIAALLKKHNTVYKIVIAPLYDQIKINPRDLQALNQMFTAANVYDYSGINSITANKYNYNSDAYHYRKRVGNLIYRQIYEK